VSEGRASARPGLGADAITAIRAATYWPAVQMKVVKHCDSVNEGKYAEIIALKARCSATSICSSALTSWSNTAGA